MVSCGLLLINPGSFRYSADLYVGYIFISPFGSLVIHHGFLCTVASKKESRICKHKPNFLVSIQPVSHLLPMFKHAWQVPTYPNVVLFVHSAVVFAAGT